MVKGWPGYFELTQNVAGAEAHSSSAALSEYLANQQGDDDLDFHALRLTCLTKKYESPKPYQIAAFMKVRNETLRLPYNLEYHRKLGVDHFFIVDNDSDDGTREWLVSQSDVTCFHSDLPLNLSDAGAKWFNALLNRFGIGRWCLTIDADELFVFPECESISLADYTTSLDRENADAVLSIMLDMYAKGPLSQIRYEAGRPFLEYCRFFDRNGYDFTPIDVEGATPKFMVRGGVRRRLFYSKEDNLAPVLNKLPLVKWKQQFAFWSGNHYLKPEVRLASSWGALLHFKFFSEFGSRVGQEVRRGVMFDSALEYRKYKKHLDRNPDLAPFGPNSMEYSRSRQLVDLGIMRELAGR